MTLIHFVRQIARNDEGQDLLEYALLVALIALVAIGLLIDTASAPLFAGAGLAAFASGWAIKFILITRAAYNQGFALPHTPVRGTGQPGPGVKPGWTFWK